MGRNKTGLMVVAIMVIAILGYVGCGAEKVADSGSSAPGTVSGRMVDASGQPIEGALVVFGANSPHGITDQNGQFTVSDVPAGAQQITIVAGGFYTPKTDVYVEGGASNNLGDVQNKEVGEGLDNAPHINSPSATVSGTTISVGATITKGAGGDEVYLRRGCPGYDGQRDRHGCLHRRRLRHRQFYIRYHLRHLERQY
ncbi:MAG: carboxypeptidase regulatory-like domain-containing protein [Planctomycetes bacterium]|nr:carboxypeptidase regulatory-like domain-containing protein [Planctomycetota bacterium]